jgi:hypothetical protein
VPALLGSHALEDFDLLRAGLFVGEHNQRIIAPGLTD